MRAVGIVLTAVILLSGLMRFHHHDVHGAAYSVVSELLAHSFSHTPTNNNINHHHDGHSDCSHRCSLTLDLFHELAHAGDNMSLPTYLFTEFAEPCNTTTLPVTIKEIKFISTRLCHRESRRGPPTNC